MVSSVGSAGGGMAQSWSVTGKDADKDGKISYDEFMAPVSGGSLQPADLRSAGSPADIFKEYDANGDGSLSASEINRTLPSSGKDRLAPGWDADMSKDQMAAWLKPIAQDNERLASEWGLVGYRNTAADVYKTFSS